jgi:predicted nucleic acid-binding protein
MLFGESGMVLVRDLFLRAAETDEPLLVCSINWAEVLYRVERRQGGEALNIANRFVETMPLEVVALDLELARVAARLKVDHGLGLADASAAALALNRKAELVTSDFDFKPLGRQIKIRWVK